VAVLLSNQRDSTGGTGVELQLTYLVGKAPQTRARYSFCTSPRLSCRQGAQRGHAATAPAAAEDRELPHHWWASAHQLLTNGLPSAFWSLKISA